jgi:hypothetical protein
MSRFCYGFMCASILSLSAIGCGGSGNTVVEDTRSPEEIEQALKDYDKELEETAKSATKY